MNEHILDLYLFGIFHDEKVQCNSRTTIYSTHQHHACEATVGVNLKGLFNRTKYNLLMVTFCDC